MGWMLVLSLVVSAGAVGAGASVPQAKDSSAEAKAAFDRGRAAHNAGKATIGSRGFPTRPPLSTTSGAWRRCQASILRAARRRCAVFSR